MIKVSGQLIKGESFLVCDVRVTAHPQNCPKIGPLKVRLMRSGAKLRNKISQPTSAKQHNSSSFLCFSNPEFWLW